MQHKGYSSTSYWGESKAWKLFKCHADKVCNTVFSTWGKFPTDFSTRFVLNNGENILKEKYCDTEPCWTTSLDSSKC